MFDISDKKEPSEVPVPVLKWYHSKTISSCLTSIAMVVAVVVDERERNTLHTTWRIEYPSEKYKEYER